MIPTLILVGTVIGLCRPYRSGRRCGLALLALAGAGILWEAVVAVDGELVDPFEVALAVANGAAGWVVGAFVRPDRQDARRVGVKVEVDDDQGVIDRVHDGLVADAVLASRSLYLHTALSYYEVNHWATGCRPGTWAERSPHGAPPPSTTSPACADPTAASGSAPLAPRETDH